MIPELKNRRIHFVTGKLAEPMLRALVQLLSESVGFGYSIQVMPITVAALLTPKWMAPRLDIPPDTTHVVLPGYCQGDLQPITDAISCDVIVGPKDLRDLPTLFGMQVQKADLQNWSIEIIAEINHAPQLKLIDIVSMAEALADQGADIIDIGCNPGETWTQVAETVKVLCDRGLRVSIDSLNSEEIGPAVAAGAELVLSVNSTNRERAVDWGCEVVVIPDNIRELDSSEDTIEFLTKHGIKFRIDPILEPIGLGFANSIGRYLKARQRWPDIAMMMGVGNLTELSDVDSAGINFALLGICEELEIKSVLTTQVINWARSSVKECDIARRLVRYAVGNQVPPKNLTAELVMLRDARVHSFGLENLAKLAEQIKDNNYRIVAEDGMLHLIGAQFHVHDPDPFVLFDKLIETQPKNLDAAHAFYLGYEMCKAATALTLGKNYVQDDSLDWGHLTQSEGNRHRISKRPKT